MDTAEAATLSFADWLRRELDARGWGVRTLAKKMNPEQTEVARRAVNRYLRGSLPTDAYRAALAEALSIPIADVPSSAPLPEVGPPSGDPFREVRGGSPGEVRAGGRGGEGAAPRDGGPVIS